MVKEEHHGNQFGMDYAKLAHYLCRLDYPMCAAMRVRLIRAETIAQSGQKHDLRFCRGQVVEVMPDFMKN